MNALANAEVGKYFEKYFVSAFQRVGTFRIVGKQKQGGNVASYFCAQDGRVLHVIPGPVDAGTLLREAQWVVENTKKALQASKGDGASFKSAFRTLHATKLRAEHGLVVQPITYDAPEPETDGALTYRDPSGRPLAPVLPKPAVDGPDVKFELARKASAAAPGAIAVLDRRGGRWGLSTQGQAHQLLAAHALQPIEKLYGSIFEGILGERISTKPVEVVNPFPWNRSEVVPQVYRR